MYLTLGAIKILKMKNYTIIIILCLQSIPGITQDKLDNSLLISLGFNENIKSDGNSQLSSKEVGEIKWIEDRFGNKQSAAYFNGSSYIEVENHESLNIQNMSISVWFKNDDHTKENPILFKGRYNTSTADKNNLRQYQLFSSLGNDIEENQGNENVSFQIFNDKNTWQIVTVDESFANNVWHHLVVTYDANYVKIYLNGNKVKEAKFDGKIYVPKYPKSLVIGATISENHHKHGDLVRYRKGALDDLNVYNKALPEEEIFELFIKSDNQREIQTTQVINSEKRKILIEVWDNGKVDNDTISIKLNEEWLIKNHRIDKEKSTFEVVLKRSRNYLVLLAENIGDIPPNTATMTIKYGNEKKQLELSSDYSKSEAVLINYIE